MKNKLASVLAVMIVLLASAGLFGYTSNQYSSTQQDKEYCGGVSGDTITKGMVLSWSFAYNAYTTGTYDTGTVVVRSSVENDTWVAGIAIEDATPGQTVRFVTRGVVAAKVDGSDSMSGVAAISYGYPLSTADRDGYLGSVDCDSSSSASGTVTAYGQYARCIENCGVGFFVDGDECAVTDTGILTTYDVYIDVRSR